MQSLYRSFEEAANKAEGSGAGRLSGPLKVGDLVLIKREPTATRTGPLRFQPRTYPKVYRVVRGGPAAFRLQDLHEPDKGPPVRNPVNAERLVRLDMPELTLKPGQPRVLETLEPEGDPVDGWVRWFVEKFAADGMVLLRQVDQPRNKEWVDLSRKRYRWVTPGHGGQEAPGPL